MAKIKKILILLTGLYASAHGAPIVETSAPQQPSRFEAFILSFGPHTQFYNAVQKDSSGGQRKFDFASTLGISTSLPMAPSWRSFPEFSWVLPQKAGSSQVVKNIFMFRWDVGYDAHDWLRGRLGTSLMVTNLHGRGGSTTISNGNSSSTFYYPDENRSSVNNTLDLGVEALYQDWSMRLQTYTYSLFKAEKRQVSYSIFLSYYWK